MKKLFSILWIPLHLTTAGIGTLCLGGSANYRRDVAKLSTDQMLFTELMIGGTIIAVVVMNIINVVHYAQYGVTLFGPIL